MAPPPRPVDEHPIAGLLTVSAGQVTFDAGGNDIPDNKNFSRRIHWSGYAVSGVTLGCGYNLGNRSQATVYNDHVRSGVPDVRAGLIAEGAGKKERRRVFLCRINGMLSAPSVMRCRFVFLKLFILHT